MDDAATNSGTQGLYGQVTAAIVAQLEAGTAPWQRPWTGTGSIWWPYNAVTKKPYRGINFVLLLGAGAADPRWCSRNQAARRGWRVRDGARSARIWFYAKVAVPRRESGVLVTVPIVRTYEVFRASDLEGLPPLDESAQFPAGWSAVDAADRIVRGSGATIRHGGGEAAYVPASDTIVLPKAASFRTPGDYYGTALHELGHWTGHESRLNRHLTTCFGNPDYAREELRVEIASAMLSVATGVPHDPTQHARYVGSWLKALRRDRQEIFRAAADAQRITDYLLACDAARTGARRPSAGVGTTGPVPETGALQLRGAA